VVVNDLIGQWKVFLGFVRFPLEWTAPDFSICR
jgi:hypothetical protein